MLAGLGQASLLVAQCVKDGKALESADALRRYVVYLAVGQQRWEWRRIAPEADQLINH